MRKIRTVAGDISPEALGVCYAHEHVLITGGLPVLLEPDFLLSDKEGMARDIQSFIKLGGKTLVDFMPGGLGRDPEGLYEISQRTGAHIIAVTGFHKEKYYDSLHWMYHYSAEQIANLMVQELQIGMDQWGYRGPLTKQTSIRAGLIKVATDYYKWNATTEKIFTAAAMAHQQTGIPIATHTEHGTLAMKQATFLMDAGVPANSIIIGHIDKNHDTYVQQELAQTGVYLQYDSPSRLKYGPDSDCVDLLTYAAKHGYDNQILIGMDLARRSYYPCYGGGPGLGYLIDTFVPRLRSIGLEDTVAKILVENPARAFSFDA